MKISVSVNSVAATFAGISLFFVAIVLSMVLCTVYGIELTSSQKIVGTILLVLAALTGLFALTLNNVKKEMDVRPMDVRPMGIF